MSATKTEFIYIGSRQTLANCTQNFIDVGEDTVFRSDKIRCLGVWFDSVLSMKYHINEKCRVAFFHLRNIRSIRRFISVKLCETLVVSLVLNSFDYCNSVLYGLPQSEIKKLQRVQNYAAKMTLCLKRFDSATAALQKLHWLPIKQRIDYKIALLVYKCTRNEAPQYLQDLLVPKISRRVSRSSSTSDGILFEIPMSRRHTFYDRSFAVSGPTVWNNLPSSIRNCLSLEKFKSDLKSHFCSIAFGHLEK